MTYEGWKNYPTWAVKQWIDNDEQWYQDYRQLNRKHRGIYNFAQALKDLIKDSIPSPGGLAGDLLGYSLEIVDWQELAEAIRETYPIDDDDDEDDE